MNKIQKNFGFGFMRLPMIDGNVDIEQVKDMVDAFMEAGFNYFDTAHGYLGGKSEVAIHDALTSRYPRDKYILTDKLTTSYFTCEEEIRPVFEEQLQICGVDYFDFYLMHAQNSEHFEKFKKCKAYETAFQLKEEGKIRHVGISFHDTSDVLDQILEEYPQIEVVQIQLNYLDWNDAAVQSRKCYEVCVKHNKPVIVMEPIKGGSLVNLPPQAKEIFDELQNGSYASYAIRFAASHENVKMVLSGMSTLDNMHDNISFMKDFKPLNNSELEAIDKVVGIYKQLNVIPCTACRYCVDGCPKNISIPDLFSCFNAKTKFNDWNADYYYNCVHTLNKGRAKDCIECGKCEKICPQKLPIRSLLKDVSKQFDSTTSLNT